MGCIHMCCSECTDCSMRLKTCQRRDPSASSCDKVNGRLLTNVTSLNRVAVNGLSFSLQTVLKVVQIETGSRLVIVSSLKVFSDWSIDGAIKFDLYTSWCSDYNSIPLEATPRNANIIGSCFVIKTNEN